MNTNQLVRALSADLTTFRSPLELRFAATLVPGILVAVALFAATLGPRPDFAIAVEQARFLFKFAITLLLALSSALLVWRLMRPGRGRSCCCFPWCRLFWFWPQRRN